MVYGFVKQSAGHISVNSEVGKGTTFNIYLPRVYEAPLARMIGTTAVERGSETILLVENDKSLRTLNREMLEEMGYHVLEAANASDALELSSKYSDHIHLLFSDIVMPGMSGQELAELLLTARPTMKVLLTSGYPQNASVEIASNFELGFLQKPFTREIVSKKIRELLSRSDRSL